MAPAGRQRTFELVPNAPVLGQQLHGDDTRPIYSKPPMTTKQAKKLHNQKNKGPKLSKAEQRRIELMEQDRIRKEFEKEKAQARARTAREKKKAKEEKEKEERKKKGLPLVDIHPSQDTISRFISRIGMAIGQKRESTAAKALGTVKEEDSEIATDACDSCTDIGDEEEDDSDKENQENVDDSGPERPTKRLRLSQKDEEVADTSKAASSQRWVGPLAKIAEELGADSYSRASSVDTDDPMNEALLEDQLIEDMAQASSRSAASREANEQRPSVVPIDQPVAAIPQSAAATVALPSAPKEPREPCPLSPRPQPPERSNTAVRKDHPPPNPHLASRMPSHLASPAFKKPSSPYVSAVHPRPAIKLPTIQVHNPPPKFKIPAVRPNQCAGRPKFLPRNLNTNQQRWGLPAPQPPKHAAVDTPPTSTQAFLFDHVDELFPTPTQEAKELSGDPLPEAPKSRPKSQRRSINGPMNRSETVIDQNSVGAPHTRNGPGQAPPVPLTAAAGDFFDSSCLLTQDLIISTQDIAEIDTPSKARPISVATAVPPAVNVRLPPSAVQVMGRVTTAANMSTASDTVQVQTCIKPPQNSASGSKIGVNQHEAGTCCPRGSLTGSHHIQGHSSSCPSSRNPSPPQLLPRDQGGKPMTESRPLRSSYQRQAAVAQPRSTPKSMSINSTTATVRKPITTPVNPRPKKRMFGSSGPGPEGLVAMERSYQEMRREERLREAQFRAQEKLIKPPKLPDELLELEVAGFTDDLLDDDLGDNSGKGSCRRPSGAVQQDSGIQPLPTAKIAMPLAASQETDYGDIDGDEFDLLKGDMSWLDEDLDDI